MRVKAQDHAKALFRANGLDVAIRIAERCVKASHPNMESALPNPAKGTTNIFFPIDRTGRGAKSAVRERARTHGFWVQVLGILNKQAGRK